MSLAQFFEACVMSDEIDNADKLHAELLLVAHSRHVNDPAMGRRLLDKCVRPRSQRSPRFTLSCCPVVRQRNAAPCVRAAALARAPPTAAAHRTSLASR
jgi:hypothetical protein